MADVISTPIRLAPALFVSMGPTLRETLAKFTYTS
jgi:hypothetical protein